MAPKPIRVSRPSAPQHQSGLRLLLTLIAAVFRILAEVRRGVCHYRAAVRAHEVHAQSVAHVAALENTLVVAREHTVIAADESVAATVVSDSHNESVADRVAVVLGSPLQ